MVATEKFHPHLVDLMETGQILAGEYDSIGIGSETTSGVVVSKGDWISKLLAESPIIACSSRKAENCEKCVILNRGCKVPIKH